MADFFAWLRDAATDFVGFWIGLNWVIFSWGALWGGIIYNLGLYQMFTEPVVQPVVEYEPEPYPVHWVEF